jgi:hypothetical protein
MSVEFVTIWMLFFSLLDNAPYGGNGDWGQFPHIRELLACDTWVKAAYFTGVSTGVIESRPKPRGPNDFYGTVWNEYRHAKHDNLPHLRELERFHFDHASALLLVRNIESQLQTPKKFTQAPSAFRFLVQSLDETKTVEDRRRNLKTLKEILTKDEWETGTLPNIESVVTPLKDEKQGGQGPSKGTLPAFVFIGVVSLVAFMLVIWAARSRKPGPGR